MRKLPRTGFFLGLACLFLLGGCSGKSERAVTVYTTVDQIFSEPIFRDFERDTGIRIHGLFDTEETKSTGVLNRIIAEAANPQCDVFWSGDPMRAIILKGKKITAPFLGTETLGIPPLFRDPEGHWIGFSARARMIIYNTDLVPRERIPSGMRDFLDPIWAGKTAIANPLFGTTSFHVAALFINQGDTLAREFLDRWRKNAGTLATSNGDVKKRVSQGILAFGLTDSDDVQEALKEGKPIKGVFPDQDGSGTLIIPNTLSLIRNSPNQENAKRFMEYMLTAEVEVKLAISCAQMPILSESQTASVPFKLASIRPLPIDYAEAAKKAEAILPWLKNWVNP